MAKNKGGVVLFLTEGKNPDKVLVKSITNTFFDTSTCDVQFLGLNIYALYKELTDYLNGDGGLEVDTFSVLQETCIKMNSKDAKSLLKLDREDIFQIFLLFDYDGHSTQAQSTNDLGVNIIINMLKFFNDESEQGKLYINYPMVESCKYLIDEDLPRHSIPNSKTFKASVNSNWEEQVGKKLPQLTKDDWGELFANHLCVANYLIKNSYSYPNEQALVDEYSQLNLVRQQSAKFIAPYNEIVILCSVSLLLCEYFRDDLIEDWRKHV